MNPGKKIDAYGVDRESAPRPGLQPAAAARRTSSFPDDRDSFARAALRCVGVGKCRKRRRPGHVPQLPGHARGEGLHARPGAPAVRDDERRGADRGLEERAGQGRARPVPGLQGLQGRLPGQRGHGHLQGRIPVALLRGPAAAAARLRDGLDLLVGAAGLAGAGPGQLLQPDAGLERPRQVARRHRLSSARMPPFARQTFKEWFADRPVRNQGRPPVILWPDTFNNYFHPEVAQAAVEVLEAAGYQVWVPQASLCCGRPLYDFGMLDTAKRLLRRSCDTLRPQIEAAFRWSAWSRAASPSSATRLTNLFPARRGRQTAARSIPSCSASSSTKKVEGLPAAAAAPQGAGARPLPSQVDHGHGRRTGDPEEDGPGLRDARTGLLRHGRLVRLRGGALRRVDEGRRAASAAGGAPGRAATR